MVELVNVKLWGEFVGTALWQDSTATAAFEYDKSFVAKGLDLSPIHMSTTRPRIFSFNNISKDTFLGLPGLLADALPDSYGKVLLDRWLSFNNRELANPIERLCYQGQRSMGALEFEPVQDMFLEQSTQLEIASLVDIAQKIVNQREYLNVNFDNATIDSIQQIISVGTSAGGARAKAVIAYNKETKIVRSGQVNAPEGFEHWLLKLDGVTNAELGDPKYYGVIEYIYYLMAKEAGIDMMESTLLEENGRAHFMTKRFDRVGATEKLHTQTLCGLAHYDYKLLRAYSYEQLFQLMRKLRLPYIQAEEMFRRVVFNVIARNQDDHTKNTSFIMNNKGTWSLSPAYDVSWAYNPKGFWTSMHQMSINNKWDDFERQDLLDFAIQMNIKKPAEIIEQVKSAVSKWRNFATQHNLASDIVNQIESSHRMQL